MLSSYLDTLLKVSKTTYPKNLFAYDCVTPYVVCELRLIIANLLKYVFENTEKEMKHLRVCVSELRQCFCSFGFLIYDFLLVFVFVTEFREILFKKVPQIKKKKHKKERNSGKSTGSFFSKRFFTILKDCNGAPYSLALGPPYKSIRYTKGLNT